MKITALTIISIIITALSNSAWAATQPDATLRCEYNTGYGDASFYLGYIFNLKTGNFQNLTDLYAGPLNQTSDASYTFVEATGIGKINFENGYALLTHSNLNNPVPFVLKCKMVDPNASIVEYREFEIFSEDIVDSEIRPNIEFMNYCGNDTAIFKLDLSKYLEKNSTWFGSQFTTYAERSQFGPSFDCLPGERRRENFKALNQVLNEARAKNNSLPGKITIRKEQFAPSGYAVKIEIKSEKLGRTLIFRDNLNAKYDQ